ncbi:plasmid mobilization relaxosome protein MobC [Bdellovibrionota bacterium FG-1]
MGDELIPNGVNMKERRSTVRFERDEYLRMIRDRIETGKSIPWLLKTAYFRGGISAPALDAETRKAVRRELAAIGNNLNQLARAAHTLGIHRIEADVCEAINLVQYFKTTLLGDYGDR